MLYQAYAYLLPAFSKQQQRTIVPLLLHDPGPLHRRHRLRLLRRPARRDQVPPQLQRLTVQRPGAGEGVLRLLLQTLLACGIVFQIPVGILAVTRLGIVKVQQLTKNRRYAYLVCAIVAAALPGVDPVSMLLEMAPLIVLYELSIVLARIFGQPGSATAVEPASLKS